MSLAKFCRWSFNLIIYRLLRWMSDYLDDINITMTLQVTTMGLPNPPQKASRSQTQWYQELIPAARASEGETGATWRPWLPSTTTWSRRTRTRGNCPPMVSRNLFLLVLLLLLLLLLCSCSFIVRRRGDISNIGHIGCGQIV